MNTSADNTEMKKVGGAFADGLTLIRVLLTPIIMFLIIAKGWPEINTALLAFALFFVAALTDIFDDMTGGAQTSRFRKFGWFDDIADTVLMAGTLLALLWVVGNAGSLSWVFAVPAGIIIAREVLVGLTKGFEISKHGVQESRLGDLKTAIIILSVCILLASPWLTVWFESLTINDDAAFDAYSQTRSQVWNAGIALLWLGAILSVITGFRLMTDKSAANDG